MSDQLKSQAKNLICETLEIPAEEITDTTKFVEDLGIDSILIIELKTVFEETYSIKIDKNDLINLNSLKEAYDYLNSKGVKAQ